MQREVKEELAVKLSDYRYFGIYMDIYGDTKLSTLNIVYICELAKDPKINANEFDEIKWFDIEELPDDYAFESMNLIIQDYIKYLANK